MIVTEEERMRPTSLASALVLKFVLSSYMSVFLSQKSLMRHFSVHPSSFFVY